MYAAKDRHAAVVNLLLEIGPKDMYNRTPLWLATMADTRLWSRLLKTGIVEADTKDDNGQTPLLWTA